MKTVRSLVELSTQFLTNKGITSARRQSEDLLAFCLGVKRLDLYLDYDRPVEEAEVDQFRSFIKQKGERRPFEYIVGRSAFLGLELSVNSDVLIPRQETEVCLDHVLKEYDLSGKVVWDIATGSGCIGLACKKQFPTAHVTLSDISPEALNVAKHNAAQNSLEVGVLEGDLLTPFQGKKADIVFCNPPYISQEAYEALEPEVKVFEPKGALVAPNKGLACYQKLAQELPAYLTSSAHVFLEIGFDQAGEVANIFSASYWKSVSYVMDLAGVQRFISLEFSQNL